MTPTLLEGPASEPVSLADVKAHLRLTSSDEDGLLGKLIVAARLTVEVAALRAMHVLGRAEGPPRELCLSPTAHRDLREALRRQIVLHLDAKLKSQKFLDEILAAR